MAEYIIGSITYGPDTYIFDGNYVSDVSYSARSLQKTINGTTTTVFTADNTPTQNSNNPITSGAVYTVLDDTINTVLESVLGGNA